MSSLLRVHLPARELACVFLRERVFTPFFGSGCGAGPPPPPPLETDILLRLYPPPPDPPAYANEGQLFCRVDPVAGLTRRLLQMVGGRESRCPTLRLFSMILAWELSPQLVCISTCSERNGDFKNAPETKCDLLQPPSGPPPPHGGPALNGIGLCLLLLWGGVGGDSSLLNATRLLGFGGRRAPAPHGPLPSRYLTHLVEVGDYKSASSSFKEILGTNAGLWEKWISILEKVWHATRAGGGRPWDGSAGRRAKAAGPRAVLEGPCPTPVGERCDAVRLGKVHGRLTTIFCLGNWGTWGTWGTLRDLEGLGGRGGL